MATINTYLTFNGNCREAMIFYKQCLGGALSFQTINEPISIDKMRVKMKQAILHATLIKENFVLMGTDMVSEGGLMNGNGISIMLHCNSEKEFNNLYKNLSQGCEQSSPPEITFWGDLFAGLTDRYGKHWLLHLIAIRS